MKYEKQTLDSDRKKSLGEVDKLLLEEKIQLYCIYNYYKR